MATATAVEAHVAGPVEREPAQTAAGWRWSQRCLRCDTSILHRRPVAEGEPEPETVGRATRDAATGEELSVQLGQPAVGGFFKVGTTVYELDDGTIHVELPDGTAEPDHCWPDAA